MMKRHIVTYERFDVVIVPFPFTDEKCVKRRPALVCSSKKYFNALAEHSVMAMITSAKNSAWPLDVTILDLETAGLPSASLVRMKLFTLDHRYILKKIGHLSTKDGHACATALSRVLALKL